MISALHAHRGSGVNTAVLARLAERWRPAGLYLACLDRDGNLVWQDSQMPRVLSLCLAADSNLAQRIRGLGESLAGPALRLPPPLPFLSLQLAAAGRRRKSAGWIIFLARTGEVSPNSEELARIAQRASLDTHALCQQAQRAIQLTPAMFTALVSLAEQMHDDLQAASVANHELASVTEQLTSVYEEISLLYKISSGMRFSQKPESFLETVCREMQEIGNFRTIVVAPASQSEEGASPVLGQIAAMVGNCGVPAAEILNALHEPIYDALNLGETQVHNEIAADCDWARLRTSIRRLVCVPLERDRRPLGIMIAIDKQDQSEFNSVDLKLLNNVGNQCSIFLENAALYQDMQGLFMGVLHALTRSIDAKDAYTRGHSQRVAELSRALARKIGLSDEQCERIYLSGLLHDVGKIGVPEAVLTKPGRLTDEEFEAIRKHPAIGAQILGNIKQLQDIIPGVLFHHERWDGRGYPHQRAGEDIPLMGRIICVADSFDAMTSTRTYRPALPLPGVLAEIQRCAGTQFDPSLAKVFVSLDFESYRRSVEEQTAAAVAGTPTPLLESSNGAQP